MGNENQDVKVIVFQLNNEEYGIPVEFIGSIERMEQVTRVPGTPDFVKGVINLRGIITPIIDLRERFDLDKSEYNDQTRIIVTHIEDMTVGMVVDSANDVIDIPVDAIEPPPEVIGSIHVDYIRGVAKLDKRLLILLHIDKVLSKDELTEIEKVEG
ncbi:chemotaxis protein CheW [Salinibacillus xinjiangensis]|uniref:Chemotaxis protein CheW n=1 Tax=Salinibacillus xinjiangensis TaxID=1229268 RepID=A0A6G1X3H0_9BACI|nr:chemotaxis protein CheW [Salinibacillus xinjiangensis]MRG85378.1 chemotaxis protein CheW [Salinibacillus xinjiangensis]